MSEQEPKEARNGRSPLRDKPLRNPGQSLEERRRELIYDVLITPLFLAGFMCILAAIEWLRFFRPSPPAPYFATAAALVACAYAAYKIRGGIRAVQHLKQGLEGERAVGQYLEALRVAGYQVFHDVVGEGFNLDHVLIGPTGVYVIETKTWSKPRGGDPKIRFDGERLIVDGVQPDRDPVIQAKAQASWLREVLSQSTGRAFSIRPVIVFPGWYVEQEGNTATKGLWVLNPRALKSFLEQEPQILESEDVALASFHLSRFIRAGERRNG